LSQGASRGHDAFDASAHGQHVVGILRQRVARLLPRAPGLGIEPLGEIDEVGETMLLVGVDLNFLVEAIDERGQTGLLVPVRGAPRGDRRRRGGGKGIPGGRERNVAAASDEDTDEGQRAEGATGVPSDSPARGPSRQRVVSDRRG
jgi:hypothetical protein